jgi:hypothetical protein
MMKSILSDLQILLLEQLGQRGIVTSPELQSLSGKSQATVSRALAGLSTRGVVAFGRARARRYGLCRPILNAMLGQQPIWLHDLARPQRWGTLTCLAGDQVHVEAGGVEWLERGRLPWFLAPLRLEGFLGRLQAGSPRLAAMLGADPSRWRVEEQLYAAIAQVHDAPGAMTVGDPDGAAAPEPVPTDDAERLRHYDTIADDVTRHLPGPSSAAGEQPKFLATRRIARGGLSGERGFATSRDPPRGAGRASPALGVPGSEWEQLLVKFAPPRGTPFGERWHDLLHAEALALATLAEAGEPAAQARVLSSARRTYLESIRFDRIGRFGRRHAVPLWAAHDAFVALRQSGNWATTADELHRQGRLSAADAQRVRLWQTYGELIGNNDMHRGNLTLWADDPRTGRFEVAPCYDMLPMRYKPEPAHADFGLTPIEPARPLAIDATWQQAQTLALRFWQRLADHAPCSAALRDVADANAQRVEALIE